MQPDWAARLPEHEVRDDCEGARSPLVVAKCREKGRGVEVNVKNPTNLAANSHEDDRSDLARR